MKKYCILLLCLCIAAIAVSQQKKPTAKEILATAKQQAAKENKNILLIFRASWCGWCHNMDSSLNDPSCKQLFDDHFVITHLTVHESTKKKNEETAGADELLKQYKAFKTGIPFWVVLDKDGNLLKDSFIKKTAGSSSNIGCPASEKEVAAFVRILKATSVLTEKELAIITTVFRKNDTQ